MSPVAKDCITLDDASKQIDIILTRGKGSLANLCMAYWAVIRKTLPEDRHRALRYLAENFDPADSSDEMEIDAIISSNEEKTLEGRFEEVTTALLSSLIKLNLKEEDFYKELCEIIEGAFFKEDRGRAIALKVVLEDKRIPYFFLHGDGLKMANDEFRRIRKALYKNEAKIRFLLSHEFSQKTEQADLVLRELKEVPEKEQVVLMAILLKEARTSGRGGIEMLAKLASALM